jgi:biotin carboxyl carrier protein
VGNPIAIIDTDSDAEIPAPSDDGTEERPGESQQDSEALEEPADTDENKEAAEQEPAAAEAGEDGERVEVVMPQMGESVMEGTIIEWTKKIGDSVEVDDPLLEIATDKVDTEVPSPESGTLVEILAEAGETVEVGQAIAIIQTGKAPAAEKRASTETEKSPDVKKQAEKSCTYKRGTNN